MIWYVRSADAVSGIRRSETASGPALIARKDTALRSILVALRYAAYGPGTDEIARAAAGKSLGLRSIPRGTARSDPIA